MPTITDRYVSIPLRIQVLLLTNDYKSSDQSLSSALVKSPAFWLLLFLTGEQSRLYFFHCFSLSTPGLIILPWLQLRKVPVQSVVLSDHAVRLYFDYGKNTQYCILIILQLNSRSTVTTRPGHFTRISDNPLMEWHGFATINEPGRPGYSLLVSKAGCVTFP